MPNALAVIAMGPRGSMLHAPDVYMDKLAIGPGYATGVVSLDMTTTERISALAKAKGTRPDGVMVCVLERPRHETLIAEIRATGARIRLITDGDVAGVIHCAEPDKTGIDMYMGTGGAPEGVLAAAALKCMGGQMMGKLLFRNDAERERARKHGVEDLDKVYTRDEMVTQDVIFAATGVTDGSIVRGRPARRRLARDRDHPDALQDRLAAPAALPPAQPVGRGAARQPRGHRLHGGLAGALDRRHPRRALDARRRGSGAANSAQPRSCVIWLGFAGLGLYAGVRRLQTLTGLAPPEGAPRRSPRNWKDGLTPEPFPPDPGPRAVDPQVPAAPTETRLPG